MYQSMLLALHIFCARCFFACDVACSLHQPAHHSRSLCVQAAFVLRAYRPPACLSRLHVSVDAARAPYFLHSLFFACDVACCLHQPTHHSRSLCPQAAFVLRAHQPPACFSRLHVSVDAADRAPYFLHSLFFACDVACCLHLPITRAACVLRLHSY